MTISNPAEIGKHPAYVWIILVLCIIAVILNGFVIYAVVKFGRYNASIDIFLTNLAASDIIHAGIVTPVHFRNVTSHDQNFIGDNFVCKVTMFLPLLSVMVAICTIVAMAIDRYRVIVTQKKLNRRDAITAIIVIWIASVFVSAPQLYEYNVYYDVDEYNQNITFKSCGSEGIVDNFETIYASLVLIFAFLVPFIVLVVCYTQIMSYVWKHTKRFRMNRVQMTQNNTNGDRGTRKMLTPRMIKLIKMLIWITATFLGLWSPYFVIFAITEVMGIDDTSNFTEWPHVVCRAMTVLSTVSNPVVYLAFSESIIDDFGRAFRNVTCVNGQRQQTTIRSNKIVPSTSNAQQKVYPELLDVHIGLKRTSVIVFDLEQEQSTLKNNCITTSC